MYFSIGWIFDTFCFSLYVSGSGLYVLNVKKRAGAGLCVVYMQFMDWLVSQDSICLAFFHVSFSFSFFRVQDPVPILSSLFVPDYL